jgi:hypothetical protein
MFASDLCVITNKSNESKHLGADKPTEIHRRAMNSRETAEEDEDSAAWITSGGDWSVRVVEKQEGMGLDLECVLSWCGRKGAVFL